MSIHEPWSTTILSTMNHYQLPLWTTPIITSISQRPSVHLPTRLAARSSTAPLLHPPLRKGPAATAGRGPKPSESTEGATRRDAAVPPGHRWAVPRWIVVNWWVMVEVVKNWWISGELEWLIGVDGNMVVDVSWLIDVNSGDWGWWVTGEEVVNQWIYA